MTKCFQGENKKIQLMYDVSYIFFFNNIYQ